MIGYGPDPASAATWTEKQYGIANGAAAYIYNNIDKTVSLTSITSIRRNASERPITTSWS